MNDCLGDRMKKYENIYRFSLPLRSYTLLRLDGKAFHTYTKQSYKPFDLLLIEDFQQATLETCKDIPGCVLGFHESDEVTLLLTDFENIDTQSYYGNNLQKLVSIICSKFTAKFNKLRYTRYGLHYQDAEFDCRVWNLSDPFEVDNVFIWRQKDAITNSISQLANHYFSDKLLKNKNSEDRLNMLYKIGVFYDNYPTNIKRGSICYKNKGNWVLDVELPNFIENRDYLRSKIPLISHW